MVDVQDDCHPSLQRISTAIGVDIGGSHVGLGLLDSRNGKLIESVNMTLLNLIPEDLISMILSSISTFQTAYVENELHIQCIGIGCPGQCLNGTIVAASNLPGWKDVPLARLVSDAFGGVPVVLMNDADAAVAAEVFGSEDIISGNVALVTLGTGIGTGLVLQGRVYSGQHGLVEGGHSIVEPGGRPCACGQRGCVEAYGSALSTCRRMWEVDALAARLLEDRSLPAPPADVDSPMSSVLVTAHSACTSGVLEQEQGPLFVDPLLMQMQLVREVLRTMPRSEADMWALRSAEHFRARTHDARAVFERAQAGDPLAELVLDESSRSIALLCINLSRLVDVGPVLLGGGMAAAGPQLLDRVRKHISALSWTVLPTYVDVRLAKGGADAGIRGAALAALQSLTVIRAP